MLKNTKEHRDNGIYLTCVGVGMSNHNDALMEQLADRGDGQCVYVDRLEEAKKVFVENLTGTLQTVARDVKIQVEFDPAQVIRYRLMGYENRAIADAAFRNGGGGRLRGSVLFLPISSRLRVRILGPSSLPPHVQPSIEQNGHLSSRCPTGNFKFRSYAELRSSRSRFAETRKLPHGTTEAITVRATDHRIPNTEYRVPILGSAGVRL